MACRIPTGRDGWQRPVRLWLLVASGIWGLAATAPPAAAQPGDRCAPTQRYHQAFADFYAGQYKDALEQFQNEGRTSVKTPQSRWIDSICYETMCGECYYHMGAFSEALTHYTSALEIYLAFPNWLVQVQFATGLRADISPRKPVPWATRRLQAPLCQLQYQTRQSIGMGQLDATEMIRQGGGVFQQATLFPIEPAEIIRTTVLAIRRRAELLGPLAAHDPLFDNLIAALSRRPGPPNHWSEAWINLELGAALAAGAREGQAVAILQRATIAAGEFEHPLSGLAHLELGRLAAERGDYPTASQHFEEASYAAFYYFDPAILEEAFRSGALVHLMANRKGMFAPLAPALQWCRANVHLHQLHASLALLAAENYLVTGNAAAANEMLGEAHMVIGRRQMAFGRIGARRSFLSATSLFQQRKIVEGDAALAEALKFMRQGSLWLFQVAQSDKFYLSGNTGAGAARTALDVFHVVLRDPQPADWVTDPMEALAVLTTPHSSVYEHWFEAAIVRKEHELAIEIADRARRHRFFTSLALGGRLESLRWVLEGSKEMLGQQALLQRQDLQTRYPEYDDLRQQAETIRAKLASLPLVPDDADAIKQQTQKLTQLAIVSHRQEGILREMAVRRDPAMLAFPPLRTTADIQKSLPKGHALLIFFATSRAVYGFLLDKERYGDWQVGATPIGVGRQVAALLRDMGLHQQNQELRLEDLVNAKWKPEAHDLLDLLLKGSRADFATKFDELIVVPDGVLWYLPFEALQVQADGQLYPLISRFRVRYAPTASLAMSPPGWGHRRGNTAVVLGHLYPKLDDEATRATFTQLAKALPGTVSLRLPLPGPSPVFATLLDRLIVLDDLAVTADMGPYGWSPLPLDRAKTAGTLADWFLLPWGGPEEIILPGFHTASEEALKRVSRTAAGNEVFLAVCGLMTSGARTILLSRWRSGGQTSLDLVREFAQELPHTTPAEAWQRAVLVVASSPLSFEAEPRIKRPATEESLRANHPFFWAGYLLVDSGGVSGEAAPVPPPAAPPPAKAKNPLLPGAKPDLLENPK